MKIVVIICPLEDEQFHSSRYDYSHNCDFSVGSDYYSWKHWYLKIITNIGSLITGQ
jgi:hypothetical protein